MENVNPETRPFVSSQPNYALSNEQVDDLTARLFVDRASETPTNFRYIAIELSGDSEYANIARNIERRVFEVTFPSNNAEMLAETYGPYDQSSRFFVSIDRTTKQATGALRIIENSASGLMTLNDVKGEPFLKSTQEIIQKHKINNLDKVWDVGTVAVLPEHRNGVGSVSVQLYRAMYLSALNHGIDHLVSIIDRRALSKLTKYLAIPFVPLAGAKSGPYLDSQSSQPVYGFIPEFYKKMSRHRERTIRGYLARGALDRLVEGSEDDSLVFDDRL